MRGDASACAFVSLSTRHKVGQRITAHDLTLCRLVLIAVAIKHKRIILTAVKHARVKSGYRHLFGDLGHHLVGIFVSETGQNFLVDLCRLVRGHVLGGIGNFITFVDFYDILCFARVKIVDIFDLRLRTRCHYDIEIGVKLRDSVGGKRTALYRHFGKVRLGRFCPEVTRNEKSFLRSCERNV